MRVVKETHSLIFATVLSTLTAAAVHGIVGTVAFALTGIKSPLFWGVLMGFFSFIPLIGTALIWVPLSLSLALGGHLAAGIILAAYLQRGRGMIDNFVRPLMISGRAEMSRLLIFIGVLGGIKRSGCWASCSARHRRDRSHPPRSLCARRACGTTAPKRVGRRPQPC